MKIALLVVATGAAEFFNLTLPRLGKLARQIGADFICQHTAPPDGMKPTWAKLPLLERHAPHYDRLIICDADLFPVFGKLTKQDLAPLLSAPAAMAPDHGMPLTSSRFSAWCKHYFGEAIPEGLPYWNAGLMAFSQETALFLVQRFRAFGRTPDEFYHEQDFLNFQLHRHEIQVRTLPQEMNWIAPQLRDATLSLAKFIHFAGGYKSLIADYCAIVP